MDLFEDNDNVPALDPLDIDDLPDDEWATELGDDDDEEAPWFECDCDLCNGFDDFTRDEDGW